MFCGHHEWRLFALYAKALGVREAEEGHYHRAWVVQRVSCFKQF